MNINSIQIDETSPQAALWVETVGGFFRNFALIEWVTVEFARRMADPFKFKSMKKKFLAQRLTWISDNIHEQPAPNPEKAAALIELLDQVRELSYFRNILAHAALGFSVPGADKAGTPSLAGVLNYKPDDEDEESELISIADIKERLEESAALAKGLLESLKEFAPALRSPAPQARDADSE